MAIKTEIEWHSFDKNNPDYPVIPEGKNRVEVLFVNQYNHFWRGCFNGPDDWLRDDGDRFYDWCIRAWAYYFDEDQLIKDLGLRAEKGA